MHQPGGVQPLVGEARRLGEREVDLHAPPAVAVARRLPAEGRRHLGVRQQAQIELVRIGGGHHRPAGPVFLSPRDPHAHGLAALDQDLLHGAAGADHTAVILDQAGEGAGEALAAPLGRGHAAAHDRGERQRHPEAAVGAVGRASEMEHPGGREGPEDARAEARLQHVAGGQQEFRRERRRAGPLGVDHQAAQERRGLGRGEVHTEEREDVARVDVEFLHHLAEGLAVPRVKPVGLGHVGLQVAEEDGALAVRQRDAGRPVGVQIAQAALRQLRAEIGVGLRGDEQGVGARIDVVAEAGEGQLLGPHQTAGPVVPLQHQNAPPRAG